MTKVLFNWFLKSYVLSMGVEISGVLDKLLWII